MFGFKKNLNSEEYEKLSKKLVDVEAKLSVVSTELEQLKTNQNSIRGLINRKLNPEKVEEVIEEGETETNKNPNIFLAPNGSTLKHR